MARRSPTVVNQSCETGCTWRMFGIFNFREGHFSRRLVSNTDVTGNGSSRRCFDVLSKVDDNYLHVGGVSSRRRDYGCKSISCVENVHVAADQGNKVTKMTIDQKFVDRNYQAREGAGCHPEQLLDALQILYSNKDLFLNLLQDPNSLLVKQIHDLQNSSQVKNSYQAVGKKSNSRQCRKPFKSFEGYDSASICEPQFSNKIVVLKPCSDQTKSFADARFDSPWPNAQNVKPSHFPLGRIKRKLRYVMRVRGKEQKWRKELEIGERDSRTNGNAGIEERLNSSLDLKDSELCMGNEVASLGESCSSITNNGFVSPSEDNTFNLHVKGRKSQSDMVKHGIEEFKAKSLSRLEPLPVFDTLSSSQRYYNHSSDEGLGYCYSYQMGHRTKLGLQKEGENGSYSSLTQKIKDASSGNINTFGDKSETFGTDIIFRESLSGGNLHADYDTSTDGRYKDSYTRNFNKNNSTGGIESFQDSLPEIQSLSFSPEVASSSPSSCERTEDTINTINIFEQPITETVVGSFTGEIDINPPVTTFEPDGLPEKVMHEKFEENNVADLLRSSLDPTNNLASSKDTLKEIMQVFTLKWDEFVTTCELSSDLHDPSTFDELKGSIGQLSCDTILLDRVIETFMDVYKNRGFPLYIARKSPNMEAYVAKKILVDEIGEFMNLHFLPQHPSQITLEQLVGKDLSRSGSWMNIQIDTEDIVVEVEEHVLENLVLEIVSEMDMKARYIAKQLKN